MNAQTFGFTYPIHFKMDAVVEQILLEVINGTTSPQAILPDVRSTHNVFKSLIDKINRGYSVHQSRLPNQIWGNIPPEFEHKSFKTLKEPNVNEIVSKHPSTKGKSDASKKAVVAAALRNMRDYEFIMALKQIMQEANSDTISQTDTPGLWSMRELRVS